MNGDVLEKCFDEGTIQAFLDGELSSDLSEKVACHLALCDECAGLLAVAEEESSFAFAALDAEFNALVPSERIRARLFETIATERTSFWQRIFGKGFRWTNPSVAAFASLLLVVGLFATLWIARENSFNEAPEIAADNGKQQRQTIAESSPAAPAKNEDSIASPVNPAVVPFEESDSGAPQIRQAVSRPRNENRIEAQKAAYRPPVNNSGFRRDAVVPVEPSATISGEQSYLKTIATLQRNVENRKDELMKPSMRVAFEKDMAVVDDAIKKMQREVRRNPKNEAAREVLRSSYQNKIDLLNSVAEKSELMASLRP
ncbi:MAG TPA: zf-HC2 domain-containing protein [Pyrinomonadaceae bacterium]|nr:zf-HC2 domain-containing protein [Pyrinomonadaceae bacterium]